MSNQRPETRMQDPQSLPWARRGQARPDGGASGSVDWPSFSSWQSDPRRIERSIIRCGPAEPQFDQMPLAGHCEPAGRRCLPFATQHIHRTVLSQEPRQPPWVVMSASARVDQGCRHADCELFRHCFRIQWTIHRLGSFQRRRHRRRPRPAVSATGASELDAELIFLANNYPHAGESPLAPANFSRIGGAQSVKC
jgi:hypothetical protein